MSERLNRSYGLETPMSRRRLDMGGKYQKVESDYSFETRMFDHEHAGVRKLHTDPAPLPSFFTEPSLARAGQKRNRDPWDPEVARGWFKAVLSGGLLLLALLFPKKTGEIMLAIISWVRDFSANLLAYSGKLAASSPVIAPDALLIGAALIFFLGFWVAAMIFRAIFKSAA